ncbi:MAG: EAL domain-containing protein [Sulfurospirillaceae bacterium]|nr:EAL domain-containing protein [Sulfurospirillaceae bacterium]
MKKLITALFEHSPEAMFIMHDNHFIDCNTAATQLFDYDNKSFLLNRSPSELSPKVQLDGQLSCDKERNIIEAVLGGETKRFEWVFLHSQGNEFMVEVALSQTVLDGKIFLLVLLRDITEKKRAEKELFETNQELIKRKTLLKQIFDTSSVAIFLVDRQGYIVHANQRMADMFGWSIEELITMEYVALIHPNEREIGRQKMLALLCSEVHSVDLERAYWRADETIFWGHLTGKRFYGINGEELGLVGVIADITEKKRIEEKLKLIANVFTHAREGIAITDDQGVIIDVNDTFSLITGYSKEEALGQTPRLMKSGRYSAKYYAKMWQTLAEKGQWSGEIWNRRKNGEVYAQMQTISAVHDAHGRIQHYVSLFTDITTMKQHQQQLEHIAHYDALTNLPNRVLLADRLKQAMAHALRQGKQLAVVYLDLDGFKVVNDTYGHNVGDELLIILAKYMREALREGDTMARLGGDEFVAVLVDLEENKDCKPLIERLLQAASRSVKVGEISLQVSASIGVTFYPQDGMDADQLMRQADQAMYLAKQTGKNNYSLFDIVQDGALKAQRESLEDIVRAIEQKEFILYYQPKVNMKTGEVIGTEALIRWQHPKHGLLQPSAFLPILENHPMSIPLGEWVIETALIQIAQWHELGLSIPISVNVGGYQLQQSNFVERLEKLLMTHSDVDPCNLELEILETSALEDISQVSDVIHRCHNLGVHFALDDFGTGYSSLTYLKHLPAELLKIDQSFVRDMLSDPDDLAIIEGILGLAKAFRRNVIAEGVETIEHGELLLALGCEWAQGYGIARPMPSYEFPKWIQSWKPDIKWTSWQNHTVNPETLPLLFAEIEHRVWITALESFFKGEKESHLPMDAHLCRFGMWYEQKRKIIHSKDDWFDDIGLIHERIHEVGKALLEIFYLGQKAEALSRMNELHTLSHALIEKLREGILS